MSSADSLSIPAAPWWSRLIQPFQRAAGPQGLPYPISLSLHQSLVCGAHLSDQVAALQTRSAWQLGVVRKRLWQFGIERATELFYRKQVPVATLSWAGGFTGSLGFRFQEAVDDALTAIEEADRIGAETLVIAPGGQGTFTYRHARRFAIDGVQRIVGAAASRRIRLAVLVDQQTRFSPQSLVSDWDAALEFLDEVGSPHVGLAASFPTWCASASTQPWEACASRLHVVTSPAEPSLSVHRRSGPGAGIAEAAAVLERLCAAGFRGVWEFAAPTHSPPWWNSREALLQCSSWVNQVARELRQTRAG